MGELHLCPSCLSSLVIIAAGEATTTVRPPLAAVMRSVMVNDCALAQSPHSTMSALLYLYSWPCNVDTTKWRLATADSTWSGV